MIEKPQVPQGEKQEDLLEQIIAKGLEKINTPTQATAPEESPPEAKPSSPKQEDRKAAPPEGRKSRRTAAYLYLLILFGAAFLMLLLAYFVQQRSNKNAISDLHLSREQLLDQIRALEERNNALEEQNVALSGETKRLGGELSQWQTKYSGLAHENAELLVYYSDAAAKLVGWQNSWLLEQSYQAGDYGDCIAIFLLENMGEYGGSIPNKELADRREEIVQALIEQGLLPEDRQIHISDYRDFIDAYLARHPNYYPPNIEWD